MEGQEHKPLVAPPVRFGGPVPPPPETWPTALTDDVERALRDAVADLHVGFGRLRSVYRGARFDWDKSPGREWIAARLVDRLFPK